MKLYIILLSSLSTGLKCAQACHALHAFLMTATHADVVRAWEKDNNIVVLQHEDPTAIAHMLERHGHAIARFHEPDLDGALTAVCAEPAAWSRLSSLPLAT